MAKDSVSDGEHKEGSDHEENSHIVQDSDGDEMMKPNEKAR